MINKGLALKVWKNMMKMNLGFLIMALVIMATRMIAQLPESTRIYPPYYSEITILFGELAIFFASVLLASIFD